MLDINIPYIYIDFIYEIQNLIFKSHSEIYSHSFISIKSKIMYYNKIKSYIFEWHSKLIISMKF